MPRLFARPLIAGRVCISSRVGTSYLGFCIWHKGAVVAPGHAGEGLFQGAKASLCNGSLSQPWGGESAGGFTNHEEPTKNDVKDTNASIIATLQPRLAENFSHKKPMPACLPTKKKLKCLCHS